MKDYNEVAQEILLRRDQYVADRKRQVKRVTTILSCFCLVALVGLGTWRGGLFDVEHNPPQNPPVTEHGEGEQEHAVHYGESVTSSDLTEGRDEPVGSEQSYPAQLPAANFNTATLSNEIIAEIALMSDDFTAMPYVKLLDYYDVELPIEAQFPSLSRCAPEQQDVYGIYRTGTRGVYYDKNYIAFENGDGSEKLSIALSKAVHRPGHFLAFVDTELQFTEINGHQLAVFRYTDRAGTLCCYAEFLQNGVGWYVGSVGMNEEDFLRVLLSVVSPAEPESGSDKHTLSGTVVAVDPYAGSFGVKVDGQNMTCIIHFPELTAEDFALDDQVTVTYRGDPATIQNIWAQQLINVERTGE